MSFSWSHISRRSASSVRAWHGLINSTHCLISLQKWLDGMHEGFVCGSQGEEEVRRKALISMDVGVDFDTSLLPASLRMLRPIPLKMSLENTTVR